jgi:hypothetical protein
MAKITFNPIVKNVSGKFDNLVFRRSFTGKVTMIKLADMSNVEWSPAQQAQRRRFREATDYAKAAMADPKIRAIYEKLAKKANKRPYDLAKSDFFKGNNLLAPKPK